MSLTLSQVNAFSPGPTLIADAESLTRFFPQLRNAVLGCRIGVHGHQQRREAGELWVGIWRAVGGGYGGEARGGVPSYVADGFDGRLGLVGERLGLGLGG
ncbi:hypothetical protein ACFX2J_015407 [Malus domestica]